MRKSTKIASMITTSGIAYRGHYIGLTQNKAGMFNISINGNLVDIFNGTLAQSLDMANMWVDSFLEG